MLGELGGEWGGELGGATGPYRAARASTAGFTAEILAAADGSVGVILATSTHPADGLRELATAV